MLLDTLARRHAVHPLYVCCGLAWERAEQGLLVRFLAALRARHGGRIAPLARFDLPGAALYGAAHWSVSGRGVPGRRAALSSNYLPGRNLLLGGLGAVHCARRRIPALALALLADNPFPDATPGFLADLGRLVSRALGTRIAIRAPFRHLEKAAVIRRGRDLPLALTLSCVRPRGLRHCGRCTKCAERQHAFAAAGLPDPTRYARAPGADMRRARRGVRGHRRSGARGAREHRTGPRR